MEFAVAVRTRSCGKPYVTDVLEVMVNARGCVAAKEQMMIFAGYGLVDRDA
jgi:hypothetical protein